MQKTPTGSGGAPSSWAAFTDAQGTNSSDRNAQEYIDLDLFFNKKTTSKDISKVINIHAVKRSVRNLILTNHYEKPFHPEIGSNLRAMLFENMTPQMNHIISRQIEMLIANYEPRCRLVQVQTIPQFDRNGYHCSISFYVVNYPEPVEVESFLERLR